MSRIRLVVLFVLSAAAGVANDSNLPLGLPADQNAPISIAGYKLVTLDRKKEAVFNVDGRKLKVDLPLFMYVPTEDKAAAVREGLKAVHAELARLVADKRRVESSQLLTIFLAMDRLLNDSEPTVKPVATRQVESGPTPVGATSADAILPLERAIQGGETDGSQNG